MEKELVLVDKKDMIGLITLNRPEEMNTFNVPFAGALNEALRNLDQDDEVYGRQANIFQPVSPSRSLREKALRNSVSFWD